MGSMEKVKSYIRAYGSWETARKVWNRAGIKYFLGKKYFPFEISEETRCRQEAWRPERIAIISLVVPLYHTPREYLRQLLESVGAQTYPIWELCLVDGSEESADTEQLVREYREKYGFNRVRYRRLPKNLGIAENTNEAIRMSTGEFIGFMDHDDLLHPSALYFVMRAFLEQDADLVYTDELSFTDVPEHVQSIHLKPDFCRENLAANNYICHFTACRRETCQDQLYLDSKKNGAQDYDFLLRVTESVKKIVHIGRVLYYWRLHRDSTASGTAAKPYVVEAGKRALEEHFERIGVQARVLTTGLGPFYHCDYAVPAGYRVMVCCESNKVAEELRRETGEVGPESGLHIIWAKEPLFAALLRMAEATEDGCPDAFVFVREGFCPRRPGCDWLHELISCLQPEQSWVSAGPLYHQRKGAVQAGYCFDGHFPDRIRPLYRGARVQDPGYMNQLAVRRNVSLAGGAALAVKAECFRMAGLLAEENVSIFDDRLWFSLCLLAGESGKDTVVTPYASFWERKPHPLAYRTGSRSSGEWNAFFERFKKQLEKKDSSLAAGMLFFGRYYELW